MPYAVRRITACSAALAGPASAPASTPASTPASSTPAAHRRLLTGPQSSGPPMLRSHMPDTVVMKFGGTSVADAHRIKNAARRIVEKRQAGHQVVAVISARGKTTDE